MRALFPGHLPLVGEIENALLTTPSMSDQSNPNHRLIEMEFVLEALLQQYSLWISRSSSSNQISSTFSTNIPTQKRTTTSGQNSTGLTTTTDEETISITSSNDQQNEAFIVSAVKRLLDDMMLADEKAGSGNRSGVLSLSIFEDTLSSSSIWGAQIIPPSLLRIILKEFQREESIAYLEFWSQLYQHVTTTPIVPLHVSEEDGTVILPLLILESVRRKQLTGGTGDTPTNNKINTIVYSNMVSTGGHGKSTVPIPLKGLTDRMAAMVPLFSTNLNMEMTSMGSGSSADRIFHNGTIELSSS